MKNLFIKKLITVLLFLSVSVTLFSQEDEENSSPKRRKHIFRIQTESFFVYSSTDEYYKETSGPRSFEFYFPGFGLSYGFLFGSREHAFSAGMNFSCGFFPGVVVNEKGGAYMPSAMGSYLKFGPYFRFGRIGLAPMLDITTIRFGSDNIFLPGGYWIGPGLEADFFLTDTVALNIGVSFLYGTGYAFPLTVGVGFAF